MTLCDTTPKRSRLGQRLGIILPLAQCLAAGACAASQPMNYQVVQLGAPDVGLVEPAAVNTHGEVAGTLGRPHHAAVWSHGRLRDLGTLPGDTASEAIAINDVGDVVGKSWRSGSAAVRAFLWQSGSMRRIGPAVDSCAPAQITAGGEVLLLVWSRTDTAQRCMIWTPKGIVDTKFTARGIAAMDDRRRIVVAAPSRGTGTEHAVLWERGQTTDLGTLPGSVDSVPTALAGDLVVGYARAAEGIVVGKAYPSARDIGRSADAGVDRHACVWEGGLITDLGTLAHGNSQSEAHAVNRSGTVVGFSAPSDEDVPTAPASTATMWKGGVIYDLNDLAQTVPRLRLEKAVAVNNAGWIAVSGWTVSRSGRMARAGILLVPHHKGK